MKSSKNSGRKKFYDRCKEKLLDIKKKHLEVLEGLSGDLVIEATGDVGDQARKLQEETISLARREKLAQELNEIERALDRMDHETYGVCEETGAPIEEKRLEAIPWTTLSLEGAEIREMESKEDHEDFG